MSTVGILFIWRAYFQDALNLYFMRKIMLVCIDNYVDIQVSPIKMQRNTLKNTLRQRYNQIVIYKNYTQWSTSSSSSFGCGAGDYKISPGTSILGNCSNLVSRHLVFIIPQHMIDIRYAGFPFRGRPGLLLPCGGK